MTVTIFIFALNVFSTLISPQTGSENNRYMCVLFHAAAESVLCPGASSALMKFGLVVCVSLIVDAA